MFFKKEITGRNSHLGKFVSRLIFERVPKNECIVRLVKEDKEKHAINPYFEDIKEDGRYSDNPHENAAIFYNDFYSSIVKRFRGEVEPIKIGGLNEW